MTVPSAAITLLVVLVESFFLFRLLPANRPRISANNTG
jgi:hypothetical protein